GFRNDKQPEQVGIESPESISHIKEEVNETLKEASPVRSSLRTSTSPGSNWKLLEKKAPAQHEDVVIDGCTITLTDVSRPVWKDVPKAKLLEYYHRVTPLMLPHLADRPLSLHVKPLGATQPGLYIKDMEGRQPACADIFRDTRRHEKKGKRNVIEYLVCNNEATLLYTINLGCVDVNSWMSRAASINEPDFINIDLDPSDDDFSKVVNVAKCAEDVLKSKKLKAFLKTSGKTGIHIFIPVRSLDFAQARSFSARLGKEIHELVPEISTIAISKRERGNKVLIDPSQNDYADTLACVYSVRPSAQPAVSTPLAWKELKSSLDPASFTIDTIEKRIARKGDLFEDVLDEKIRARNTSLLLKL
ncbi:MAG TPA: hypothetical protein VGC95_07170, partial [Chitinophagaceae bacterium]